MQKMFPETNNNKKSVQNVYIHPFLTLTYKNTCKIQATIEVQLV